jgi:polygalacturonase
VDCSDIVIENCTFLDSEGAGISLGSETAAGIRNVVIANCVCNNVKWGLRFKTNRGRGGVVENVRISNLVVRKASRAGIELTAWHDRAFPTLPQLPPGPPETTPHFRSINCTGVTIDDADLAALVLGLPEAPFEEIVLRDIVCSGARGGIRCEHVKGLTLDRITIGPDKGAALSVTDGSELEVRQLKVPRLVDGTPPVELEGVRDALLTDCRAPAGVKSFLALKGSKNAEIVLRSNRLPSAALPAAPGVVVIR